MSKPNTNERMLHEMITTFIPATEKEKDDNDTILLTTDELAQRGLHEHIHQLFEEMYREEGAEKCWHDVLFNQFHDIIPPPLRPLNGIDLQRYS